MRAAATVRQLVAGRHPAADLSRDRIEEGTEDGVDLAAAAVVEVVAAKVRVAVAEAEVAVSSVASTGYERHANLATGVHSHILIEKNAKE